MLLGWIFLLVFLHVTLVQGAETGNSLVTCTACQTLQAQIDNWSCDINCKVANGNNDELVTFGLINQLIETVNQFNDTIQKQADMIQKQGDRIQKQEDTIQKQGDMIQKLKNPVCAFSARGPDTETVISVNQNTVLVFENVDLNVCGGYNSTTGIFTPTVNGTYMLSAQVRSGGNSALLFIKRNNDVVCKIWVISGHSSANTCTAPVPLAAGDSVKVIGSSVEAGTLKTNVMHFAGHLIQADSSD